MARSSIQPKSKTTEKAVGVEITGEGGGGGWTKFVKKGLGSVEGLNEIEGYKSYASCGDFEGRYHLKLEKFFMLLYCMRVKNHNSK